MDVIYVLIKEKKGETYTEIQPWFGSIVSSWP